MNAGPHAFDKARVARAFSRGAERYDGHAHVQRRAVERLLALALPGLAPPRRALDVGTGTGAVLAELAARYPAAALAAVDLAPGMARAARARVPRAALAVGDAERLPFAAGCFDLVVSSSTFQWLARLEPALAEARRVLAPGGAVAVAFFGGATLHELRGAWREALPSGAADRSHAFHGEAEVARALEVAGLAPRLVRAERVVERHPDPLALLRTLKHIGAGHAGPLPAAPGGLAARGALERMARVYVARHGVAGWVPATWEIVYAVARV